MIVAFFNTVFYQPLYNGLIFLIDNLPLNDVGLAVITLTILVKIILLPLTHKSSKTQQVMRGLEPEIAKIKEQHKNDNQQKSLKTMELYQKHGVNPFSGCLIFLIQIPVIFALYWVFFKGLNGLNKDLLYPFVSFPETINMQFLGLVDMSGKSIVLALIAGITQYFQINLTLPPQEKREEKIGELSLKEEFAKNFQYQMRYIFPVVVVFISYTISGAVALYWAVSNTISIIQELYIKKKAQKVSPRTD